MDNYRILIYIGIAVIYFFVKNKRKKAQKSMDQPTAEKRPTISSERKSFEDLLKEITDQRAQGKDPKTTPFKPKRTIEEIESQAKQEKHQPASPVSNTVFSDEGARAIYEKSIQQAKNNLKLEENEKGEHEKLKTSHLDSSKKSKLAEKIRDGFKRDGAKKAVIYTEILNRKF